MQKSYLSEKLTDKLSINPQEINEAINRKQFVHLFKPQQSSPIPEQRRLSNQQLRMNLNANSSSSLNQQNVQNIQFQHYRLHQSYFTKEELLQQESFDKIVNQQFKYFGGIKNGLKHGLGVLVTKNVLYEGQFSLNHKNGKGYIQYPNKSRYFGDFSNDKPHGHGMLQYGSEYYIGDFQNGMMHGDGLWKNQKGQKYIGKWKTNKAHGYGIYTTQKSHYQGQFFNFQKNGYGIEGFTNGDSYKGYYAHGKPNGQGEYTWSNGCNHRGNFHDGLREGQGIWTNELGDVYQGSFRQDHKNGYGTYTWINGNLYKGIFSEDMREGEGQMIWNDGSTYSGSWSRGLPNGIGLYKAKGEKAKYGRFQDNVLVQQLKQHSLHKNHHRGQQSEHGKNEFDLQKSKLYLNMIPQFPRRRKLPESRSVNRKNLSLNRTAASTMNSFKISSSRNANNWRRGI